MSKNACLTNGELELTQKIQKLFPREILTAEQIKAWQGCEAEIFTAKLAEFFANPPIIENEFLRLLKIVDLPATTGGKTIAEASDVFDVIDSNFRNLGADEKGKGVATPKMKVRVCEQQEDGTFAEIFGSFGGDVFLTQEQIIAFVKKHRSQLRTQGYATFFAFRSREEEFVAFVYFRSVGRLDVIVCRFDGDRRWSARSRCRFVVPQLA